MNMLEEETDFLNEDCRRFQEILECRLVDEKDVTDLDRSFQQRHEAECAECALYSSMIGSFSDFEEGTSTDAKRSIRETVSKRFAERSRRRLVTMAAAAAVLIAVSAAVVTLLKDSHRGDVPFELSQGKLKLNADEIAAGEQFVFGDKVATPVRQDALIKGGKSLFVALEANSKMSVLNARSNEMTLKLDKGRMGIHLVPHSGIKLAVVVPDGTIRVKGTVFIVEAMAKQSEVNVVRGSVAVELHASKQKTQESLTAGRSFSFKRHESAISNLNPHDNLLRLLGFSATELPSNTRQTNLAEETAGSKTVEETPVETRAVENAALPMNRHNEMISPTSLLQAARACRAKKDWNCAVENYKEVIKAYPNLPDAITTMVPLAQILLENLKRPESALDYFRLYQKRRPGGGLGQEALWGECRSLRKLGVKNQERTCLESYVEKYPNTLYSLMAKTRLDTILQQQAPDK